MVERPALGACDVHIWVVPLVAEGAALAALAATLPREEEQASRRFLHSGARRAHVTGRAVLRRLLSLYSGRPPQDIAFATDPHGKPAAAGELAFNLSHSGELALVAFALHCALGVDVEAVRHSDDWLPIARRFFAPAEAAALARLAAAEREAAFFRCWTRKEAYVKALGLGLAAPLADFEVTFAPGEPARFKRLPAGAGGWSLHDLAVQDGYAAALAHSGPPRALTVCRVADPVALVLDRGD